MTTYKLTYFNIRGRGEISRLVFAAAGVQYEDNRVEMDKWPAVKPTTPFGQMPVLEFDGHKLCQSKTIARFLARKFNLAGKCDLDQARADMLVDCMDDATRPFFNPGYLMGKDESAKAAIKKKFLEEQLPVSLAALENMLKQNKNGDGFFVGDELTWADLALIDLVSHLSVVGGDAQLPKYPKLQALREKVEKVPKVAAWLAKRPALTMI